jgi:hypothetical protein
MKTTENYSWPRTLFVTIYQNLEDENQHGEAARYLMLHYGTPAELALVEEINDRHEKAGEINEGDYAIRNALTHKYRAQTFIRPSEAAELRKLATPPPLPTTTRE